MRSHAFQALRPLRVAAPSIRSQYLRAATRRSPILKQLARAASSSSYTPRPRTTASPAPRFAGRGPASTRDLLPPSSGVNGPIDPQAAVIQPATVADVDPALAAQIPTPESSARGGAPSQAFTAALSGNGNGANGTPGAAIDWSSSFHGLSTTPFSPETAAVLMQPLDPQDIEVKPDGIIYLPEIKYRRILNKAFGPGGWGLAPRGELVVGEKVVTREYALVVHGRFVFLSFSPPFKYNTNTATKHRFIAQARGECQYFSEESIPTAGEGCKSNALLRCCKDLGIASELWDPRFIRDFKKANCQEIWVEHVVNKKRRQIWTRKDTDPAYPYQKTGTRQA